MAWDGSQTKTKYKTKKKKNNERLTQRQNRKTDKAHIVAHESVDCFRITKFEDKDFASGKL